VPEDLQLVHGDRLEAQESADHGDPDQEHGDGAEPRQTHVRGGAGCRTPAPPRSPPPRVTPTRNGAAVRSHSRPTVLWSPVPSTAATPRGSAGRAGAASADVEEGASVTVMAGR